MKWNKAHRERLYRILEGKWSELPIESFESFLEGLGIKWAELYHESDAPAGTVAIHEGPGLEDFNNRMCWVIPDDVATKLLALGAP